MQILFCFQFNFIMNTYTFIWFLIAKSGHALLTHSIFIKNNYTNIFIVIDLVSFKAKKISNIINFVFFYLKYLEVSKVKVLKKILWINTTSHSKFSPIFRVFKKYHKMLSSIAVLYCCTIILHIHCNVWNNTKIWGKTTKYK